MKKSAKTHDISSRRFNTVQELIRYFAVSAYALVVDYAIYITLVYTGLLDIPIAAVVGYVAGMGVSYWMTIRLVFTHGWLKAKKHYEILLFVLSGGLGVVLTYITAKGVVMVLGPNMLLAKIAAMSVSFICVYVFRKFVVFRTIP